MAVDPEVLLAIREEIRIIGQDLSIDIHELKEEVREVQRAVKGNNGTPGLVAKVTVLDEKMDIITNAISGKNNDVTQLSGAFVACRLQSSKDIDEIKKDLAVLAATDATNKTDKDQKEEDTKFGTWGWFRDKNLFPVLMVIATYLALEGFKVLIAHLD